ncbi:MAG: class I SAM-dependent methyltransferase [Rhodospirillaceae bacterium]|jgi:SAM-dependent methyltransferase|nr:class I SAM-dependent methyltransferase [Rhodospirillaceae bacterium]MBT4220542.1 class I SAM-dependent methyltransferase [Rhodospirillaceae bacterium]MBT4464081.1 class I SAM-dependent methyltransferase [Rhodospirillaceae bacterium]MBT5309515.1 class I SAM-dependent methyltransferase [Rhodospirillaceae bacterium]MBT7355342.1 class I SAM-dependent methyltransferase [Rhodospirillaceae bacterium]
MAFWDIGYFDSSVKRAVEKRKIANRIVAWELGQEYYDGARENGYGGFSYDGRWKTLIPKIIDRYDLTSDSAVLDLGSKKGFFVKDMKECLPGVTVRGIESHPYPIETGLDEVRPDIVMAPYTELPFPDDSFDFVLGFSTVYMLNIGDVIKCLKEIQRVGRGKSYITVAGYRTAEERDLFMSWTLIGSTVLHEDDWLELFDTVGYTGDHFFTGARSLNLQWE